MAHKAPKRKSRPLRRPSATTDTPQWLTQLRDEVFSDPGFPELETDFRCPDGRPAVRQRAIEFMDGRLFYRESWRAPHTLEALHTWRQELDMPSFVSATDFVRTHAVHTLRETMRLAQPQWPRPPAPRPGDWPPHAKFGRQRPGGYL
jgi:hypothetical protein